MTVEQDRLPAEMTAARIEAPHETSVVRLQRPTPGPGEVLIEVARAGICGTDVHILHGGYELARFPLVPGHEFSGTIVATGDRVLRRTVGERVTADPNIPCLTCSECQRNAFNHCTELRVLGVTVDGAFARYVVAPERVVFPIGDLSFEAGALVEPLACVVWGLKRIRVQPGDKALIYGAGPMGCLLLQAVRAAGAAQVTIIDRVPARLDVASALGADAVLLPEETRQLVDIAPLGFELVADATGVPSVLEQAIPFARSGGTVWVFGVAPEEATIRVSPYEFFRRDLSLVGTFALNKTFQEAISLIEGGRVRLEPLVSHVLPLDEFDEGLRIAQEAPERMKVQFDLGTGSDGD